MKAKLKNKKIQKQAKRIEKSGGNNEPANNGEPEIKNLTDFVTSIEAAYTNKPIYTGGRIITSEQRIYSSCNSHIIVYDCSTQKIINQIKHVNEEIINFAVCPNQKLLATFTNNHLLRLLSLSDLKILHITKIPKHVAQDLTFSADSKYLAVGFSSSFIKIFTTETMKETHSYKHHQMGVKKLSWNPNTDLLQVISVDEAKNLIIFDYILNKVIAHIEDAGKNFCWNQKWTQIITTCDQQINIYDAKSLKLKRSLQVNEYLDAINCYGQIIYFGGDQTDLFVTDLKDSESKITKVAKGTDNGVMKILQIDGGKKMIIVSAEQNLTILSSKSLEVEDVIVGFNDEIIDLRYSKGEESENFLLLSNSNSAKLINRVSHKLVGLIQGHEDTILCGEYFHPYIVTAGKDKIIKLWHINAAQKIHLIANYRGHSDDVCSVAIMQQRKIIVSVGEDKTIKLWTLFENRTDKIQIKNALSTVMAHEKSINAVRINKKQDLIATCSHDRTVKIWNSNLHNVMTLTGHKRGVWDAAFHQIQQLIVTVGGEGMIKGWSLQNGDCLWSMGEGFGLVRCQWIYYNQVVTGSIDGIVKIWDIRKKTSLSYDKHEGRIWALDVRKDSSTDHECEIISGGVDSSYIIWKDNTSATRDRILGVLEEEEQEKVHYKQFLFDKDYISAAKIAFDGNYTQLLINVLHQMATFYDEEDTVTFDSIGDLMIDQAQSSTPKVTPQDFSNFVHYICDQNINKVYQLLLTMNSTVKNYKIANKIWLEILKFKKFRQILKSEKEFNFPEQKENEIVQSKESDFELFLRKMQLYTEKHQQRIEKYTRGTYWIDHLDRQANGF